MKEWLIMTTAVETRLKLDIDSLNKDIEQFHQVHPITEDMKLTHKGVSRLVMLDRYAFKDTEKRTLKQGDFVVLTVKPDPSFPARGVGYVESIDWINQKAVIQVEEEFRSVLETEEEIETGLVIRNLDVVDKPLEIYYSQMWKGRATRPAQTRKTEKYK